MFSCIVGVVLLVERLNRADKSVDYTNICRWIELFESVASFHRLGTHVSKSVLCYLTEEKNSNGEEVYLKFLLVKLLK